MGKRKERQSVEQTRIRVTATEMEAAFRARLKLIKCPACDVEYSDRAVDWADAWRRGYVEGVTEDGSDVRDGPIKVKCELCGAVGVTDVLLSGMKVVEKG